jgi:hypothetical protein
MAPFQIPSFSDFVSKGLHLELASRTQGCHGTGRPSGPKRPNGLKGKDEDRNQDRPNQDRPNQSIGLTRGLACPGRSFALHLRCGFARTAPSPAPQSLVLPSPPARSRRLSPSPAPQGLVLPSPPAWSRRLSPSPAPQSWCFPSLRLGRAGARARTRLPA